MNKSDSGTGGPEFQEKENSEAAKLTTRGVSDRSLREVLRSLRSAGLAGAYDSLAKEFRTASEIAEEIRCDDHLFSRHWEQLLRFDLEICDVPSVLETIQRVEEAGIADDGASSWGVPIRQFVAEHRPLLDETREMVRAAAEGRQSELRADLSIDCWFRLFMPAKEVADARNSWTTILTEAARMAKERHLKPALVPDYLAPLIVNRSRHTLSFHTDGEKPNVTHYKPADLPGYAIIDAGGYSGWSTLANVSIDSLDLPGEAEAEDFFANHKEQVVSRNVSRYWQSDVEERATLPPRYVFVALQVANDRTQALARIPMLEMLELVVERFRDTEIRVVVKRHPKCKSQEVANRLSQLVDDRAIVLREDSIHDLISNSEAVFAVNSGVGSETMVHLKPIYLFGEADYNCAAHRIASRDDLWRLTQSLEPRLSDTQMKQFLCYYRTRYLVRVEDRARLRDVLEERVFSQLETGA